MSIVNNAGIVSFRGFAFQMQVFTYYASQLKIGTQVEYETFDDVTVRTSPDKLDSSLIIKNENVQAMQVKQTDLSNTKLDKIMYNWILLGTKYPEINEYILFQDSKYANTISMDEYDFEAFYSKIIRSDLKQSALVTQVKNIYQDHKNELLLLFTDIKKKYHFVSKTDIDNIVFQNLSIVFHRDGLTASRYELRVCELVQTLQQYIIESISKGEPYCLTHKDLMIYCEDICQRVTDEIYVPNFELFRHNKEIDINEPIIKSSREYKQLVYCELKGDRISNHLMFSLYYRDYKIRSMMNLHNKKINELESVSHENFNDVKDLLEIEGTDCPKKRLLETKGKPNTYCLDDHIKYGSCIYLTGDDIDKELQISWKDEP